MRDVRLPRLLVGGLLWAGVSVASAEAPAVSFRADVVPILNAHCVACHLTGQEQGGVALHARAAPANLVGVASEQSPLLRVQPGEPGRSYLFHKLNDTHLDVGGEGGPMPMGRSLDPEQIAVIARWIEQGAHTD
ncbi:MAG: hypothetical protein JJU22_08950 [Gammaproteobacteria bacterium]|nr:hypothetical protein [Gammaproteobacteria bacterium]